MEGVGDAVPVDGIGEILALLNAAVVEVADDVAMLSLVEVTVTGEGETPFGMSTVTETHLFRSVTLNVVAAGT
jgi:hypothetical protein